MIPIVMISDKQTLRPEVANYVNKTGNPLIFLHCPLIAFGYSLAKDKDLTIARGRTKGMRKAMNEYPEAEFLLFLDADVLPPEHAIETMLMKKKKVISAWIPRRGGGWVGGLWELPHVFAHFPGPMSGLTETHIVTLGCTLVHTSLLKNYYFGPGDRAVRRKEDGAICRISDSGQFSHEMMQERQTLYLDGDVICDHLVEQTEPKANETNKSASRRSTTGVEPFQRSVLSQVQTPNREEHSQAYLGADGQGTRSGEARP
jgi:hypothetical protein